MFTLDYAGNMVETILWTISLAALTPYAIMLHMSAWRLNKENVDVTHVMLFTFFSCMACSVFTFVLLLEHIPLQYRLWIEDLESGKTYYPLWEGFLSSMVDRVRS